MFASDSDIVCMNGRQPPSRFSLEGRAMRTIPFRVCAILSVGLSASAAAAVPGSLDYQGYLSDPAGAPIDVDTSIEFSIYSVESGGTPLWSETLLVPVESGLFSVTLGSPANPCPPGLFETPLWIGIDVAGDGEMLPRRALTSAAFSFRAEDADTLQGRSAADLDQSAELAALQANTVLQLDTVLTIGGGGEAVLSAPGGLVAANTVAGTANPDLIVGGLNNSSDGDDGIIASAPSLPSSDLIFQTNDGFVIELDNDGDGEDADFVIIDKDNNEIFDIEEDGQVRLHGPASMTAGDDPTFGPVLTFIGTTSDQDESGRIRFREGTAATNLRGGYIHYDGAANRLHIGVHDTSDNNLANDEDIITIERNSGQVGIGTASPTRELTVNDTDGSTDAIINVTAPNRELLLGVNQSSGGIIAMQTANDLQLRTSGTTRVVVDAAGDVEVRENLVVEGEISKVYSGVAAPGVPFAYGKVVRGDPGQLSFASRTANVTSVGYFPDGVNSESRVTFGGVSCTGPGLLDEYVISVTASQFSGTDSVLAFMTCENLVPTLNVRLNPTLGNALDHGFDFIIYKF